jgi:voltage-dependent potassium channel beta subunit
LQVSVLSFGSWVSFDNQMKDDLALESMQAAFDAGCNFFDNAEGYAEGESEAIMGRVLKELGWKRQSYVLSSKYYWGINGNVRNMRNTLNRKYLMQAVDGSLERFQTDFIDLIYCHRADPNTPIEETVWAMSDIISAGKALYWGTSEWTADEIRAAWEIAERHHLHKPVMEQPQYNLLHRTRVEVEYARLYDDIGLGTTIWSPLASGLLTGKYRDGVPQDSRGSLAGYEWLADRLTDADELAKVERLRPIAQELGCSMAQMAIAWCASNPHVSTVITGASRPSQVLENFEAIDVLARLTPEVLQRIAAAVA